jgi:uncharacterized ion transporter superfamily protein YfcC
MSGYLEKIALEAIIAILLVIIYLAFDYLWFVNNYNASGFFDKHKRFRKYCRQVKVGEVTPNGELKHFFNMNTSRYKNLCMMLVFRCVFLYIYGVIVALFLVNIIPFLFTKFTIVAAIIGSIAIIIISIKFMHNDSLKFLFDIDTILDDYNNLLINFTIIYRNNL